MRKLFRSENPGPGSYGSLALVLASFAWLGIIVVNPDTFIGPVDLVRLLF